MLDIFQKGDLILIPITEAHIQNEFDEVKSIEDLKAILAKYPTRITMDIESSIDGNTYRAHGLGITLNHHLEMELELP